jgi:predicted GIY-YIG superfamily endonuclease
MVYVEELDNQSQACKREYEIKQFSKQEKEDLLPKSFAPTPSVKS